MNAKDWMKEVSEAYCLLEKDLPDGMKRFLMSKAPKQPTASQQQDLIDASEVLLRYFFVKASRGEVFGSIDRLKRELGHSNQEQYCPKEGAFGAAAMTFWTFEREVLDLPSKDRNKVIWLALAQVRMGISWLFIPFPTFMGMSVTKRIEETRKYLSKYGSDIDIDAFVNDNPLLKPD